MAPLPQTNYNHDLWEQQELLRQIQAYQYGRDTGWGDGTRRQGSEILSGANIELVGAVEVKGPPTAETLKQMAGLGNAFAGKIKG
jgi:flavorubredoxin